MKNLLSTLFNHERYQTISVIACALLLIWFYGCEPMCESTLFPGTKISRAELDSEIDIFITKVNTGYATLEQKEQLRQLLFEQALQSAATGAFNPIALMTSVGAILGLGATADNIRKRKEIKRLST